MKKSGLATATNTFLNPFENEFSNTSLNAAAAKKQASAQLNRSRNAHSAQTPSAIPQVLSELSLSKAPAEEREKCLENSKGFNLLSPDKQEEACALARDDEGGFLTNALAKLLDADSFQTLAQDWRLQDDTLRVLIIKPFPDIACELKSLIESSSFQVLSPEIQQDLLYNITRSGRTENVVKDFKFLIESNGFQFLQKMEQSEIVRATQYLSSLAEFQTLLESSGFQTLSTSQKAQRMEILDKSPTSN